MSTGPTSQLVEFLLAADDRARLAARSLSNAGSWPEALALAQAWKAIPALSSRLQSLQLTLSSADTATLRREFLRLYGLSALRASRAIPALQGMQQAGIPVAAFKGLASMAILYGDPRRRPIQDADLLVASRDLDAAIDCLHRHGFARAGSESLAEYIEFVNNAPGFAGNKAVTLQTEDGVEIDLHWELTGSGLRAEDILGRASTATLMGATIPVIDPPDGFLLTVHHAIRENLAIESACRDLLDVRLWCRHLAEAGRLDEAMRLAVRAGAQVSALGVLTALSGYEKDTAVASALERLRGLTGARDRSAASHLTELFHYQLSNGPLGKDVFYLVHSRPWRQILRGLSTDWSGYRRSLQSVEKQLGQEKSVGERVSRLAKSVPGLRALKLARELARIKYGAY